MIQINSVEELTKVTKDVLSKRDVKKPSISICAGTGCLATGSSLVVKAFKEEIEKQKVKASIEIRGTGCHGFCEKGDMLLPSLMSFRDQGRDIPAGQQ